MRFAPTNPGLPGRSGASGPRAAQYASLGLGRAGLALFFEEAARVTRVPEDAVLAEQSLEEALTIASAQDVGISLCDGLAGVGWTAAALGADQRIRRAGELCQRIDAMILDHLGGLDERSENGDYDVLYGLVGLGVYARERAPRPAALRCLERIVERLAAQAEHGPAGISWRTSPELTGEPEQFPHGWYNLGVAHGVPGAIGFLGLACAAGIAADRARSLLDGAVTWVLSQSLPNESACRFPSWVAPGQAPRSSRLGWCYGDLGVAATLMLAAHCVDESSWERQALTLALHAAARSLDSSGVVDAAICHGAAGVGHLFNRLYQATREPSLGDAARCWFERTLRMRQPGQLFAGFNTLVPRKDGTTRRVASRGLLNGAAGIGLALLAASTPMEPAWDRWLLSSIPPRR